MRLITPEIAEFLALRLKPWSSRTINEDLIAQIPSGMLAQLELEGLTSALIAPFLLLGGFIAISALMHLVGMDPLIQGVQDMAIYLVIALILGAWEFKTFRQLPVRRELAYRYKHGKWRWER
jgi:hypothetical protein